MRHATGPLAPNAPGLRTEDGIAFGPLHAMSNPAPRPWRDVRDPVSVFQHMDHPDPREAAALAASDIAGGAAGLTIVFAGSAEARGFGLECRTPEDLQTALAPVDLDRTALRFAVPSSDAEAMLGRVLAAAQTRGFPLAHPNLDLAADPLSAAVAGLATAPGAVAQAAGRWALALDGRGIRTAFLHGDGRPHHEAGASEAEELAAVLSAGVLCLRALEDVGLFGRHGAIRFTLAADADQHRTIAKFRAFRRLWARVEQACGLAPSPVRLHGETGWRLLARTDPWTNLLRNAIACAGAILGGADSLTVLPFTGALGLPDAFARRLARNTPLVLLEEASLARVADPCAGSGAFDALTDAICAEAWRIFQGLEAGGGLVPALASGAWARAIAGTSERRRAALENGTAVIVGVTAYQTPDAALPAVLMPSIGRAAPSAALPSFRDAEAFEATS